MALQFDIIFQLVVAVEGFSTWKGKSFLGKSFANIDEGPEFDKRTLNNLVLQFSSDINVIACIRVAYKIIRHCCAYLLKRLCYECQSFSLRVGVFAYKTLSFILRLTPLFSVPVLAVMYIKQWGCDESKVSDQASFLILCFILAKLGCYILCMLLNKIILCKLTVKRIVTAPEDIS